VKRPLSSLFLIQLALASTVASASVASFTTTNQTITYTGRGADTSGRNQYLVSWGTCVFASGVTTCTVSAPFTGVGVGGTMRMILAYSGNGASPLTASAAPGSDFVSFALSAGSFVITLAQNNGATNTFYQPSINTIFNSPVCTGTPICSVSQVGANPNATVTGTVNGTFDATPIIRTSQGVISASAFGGFSSLAPGSWMEIYGTNLATVISQEWAAADFTGTLAPSTLAGTKVTIGGLPTYIDFVSPGQVNAQVPSGLASGSQPVVVTTAGGASVGYSITVKPVVPGLLAPAVFNLPAGQYVAALFPDAVTFVMPTFPGLPTARAKPGDTITLYGVGFGPVTPDSPAGRIVDTPNRLVPTFRASFGHPGHRNLLRTRRRLLGPLSVQCGCAERRGQRCGSIHLLTRWSERNAKLDHRDPQLNKRGGLHAADLKLLAATKVLAHGLVIQQDHVAEELCEARPVTFVGASR